MAAKLSQCEIDKRIESFKARGIEMLSEYKGVMARYEFRCCKVNCKNIWTTNFDKVSGGSGCARCARLLDSQTVEDRMLGLDSRLIKCISTYSGTENYHKFQCLKSTCRDTWEAKWYSVVNLGTGCPKCPRSLDIQTVETRILSLKSRSIKLLSVYSGTGKRYDFECLNNLCQYQWTTSWSSVYSDGTGCARCAGQALTKEEKEISKYRDKIRSRISNLYKRGSISTSVHKDDLYMAEVLTYCKTQVDNLPQKPNSNQKWHLDHIIPVTKFDHADIVQVKLCWDYRNLQWIPAKVNLSKSNKLITDYFNDWHYQVLDTLGLSV